MSALALSTLRPHVAEHPVGHGGHRRSRVLLHKSSGLVLLFSLLVWGQLRVCSGISDIDFGMSDQDELGGLSEDLEEIGDVESLGLGSYEEGIGPGEDFGDYEDKYGNSYGSTEELDLDAQYQKAARELAEMLREQEASPNQVTSEDVVRAGLDDDSPAAHMDGVLDLDDITFDKIQSGTASMRWRMPVFLYAPWDQACKDAAWVVRKLGRKFATDKSILITKVDVDRFSKLAERFDISTYTRNRRYTYPHFMFFEPGDAVGKHYEGKLTEEDLTDFVLDVASAGLLPDLSSFVAEFMAEHGVSRRRQLIERVQEVAEMLSPEGQEALNYYVKTMSSVLEKGDSFIGKESLRISTILEDGALGVDKKYSFRKKLNVLREFATQVHDEL